MYVMPLIFRITSTPQSLKHPWWSRSVPSPWQKSNVPPPHKKVKETCFESMKPNFFAFVTGVFLGFEEFSIKNVKFYMFV